MAILLGALLALFSLIIIIIPFLRSDARGRQSSRHLQETYEAIAKRERIYQEIKALEHDYQLGNIDEDAYQAAVREYRLEAASLIRQQHMEEESLEDVSKKLEEQIQAFRKSRSNHHGQNGDNSLDNERSGI